MVMVRKGCLQRPCYQKRRAQRSQRPGYFGIGIGNSHTLYKLASGSGGNVCYPLDQNGNQILDQNGNPIQSFCPTRHECTTLTSIQGGNSLTGLAVTITWSDSTMETAVFAPTINPGEGAATGTGWSITVAGDTYVNSWFWVNTTGKGVTKMVWHDPTGFTVFDRLWPGDGIGTPGSSLGKDFTVTYLGGPFAYNIAYSGGVALQGYANVGDLWDTLTVNFTDPGGFTDPGAIPGFTYFTLDTDLCAYVLS